MLSAAMTPPAAAAAAMHGSANRTGPRRAAKAAEANPTTYSKVQSAPQPRGLLRGHGTNGVMGLEDQEIMRKQSARALVAQAVAI